MKRKPKLFLDTSVILAAVYSATGGSRGILNLAENKLIQIAFTEEVVEEAHTKLRIKCDSRELKEFFKILFRFKLSVKLTPPERELAKYDNLISDVNDRHILAGASKYQADYLITLDKKHFFTEKLLRAKLCFKIATPKTFLQEFRKLPNNHTKILTPRFFV